MSIRVFYLVPIVLAFSLGSGTSQAALYDRGGGLIYDDVLNVTWLQDANYAKTSGYDADGQMSWPEATAWVSNLNYYDSIRGASYTDWRLPSVNPVNGLYFQYYGGDGSDNWTGSRDTGYNISAPGSTHPGSTASEMSYMHYNNLSNEGIYTPIGGTSECGATYSYPDHTCLVNVEPFVNLQPAGYWSGTQSSAPDLVWVFDMYSGAQSELGSIIPSYEFPDHAYAWAIRDGDVTAVPEPETYAMLLVGLGLVGWRACRIEGMRK